MRSPVTQRVSTGIAGLDEVLHGGLVDRRTYLLTGPPGGGKTTLGWHFLTEGARRGETVLFLTFGEPRSELCANAEAAGFSSEGVEFCDMSPSSELFAQIQSYDIFSAAEVELEPTTNRIVECVGPLKPKRVFIDSMTALRYLAKDAAEYRRQTLSFLRYLLEQGACILLTSEASVEAPDDDLRFLCDGVIELAQTERARELRVLKFRGSDYRAGAHTLRLSEAGATVFPRLVPASHRRAFQTERLSWGVRGLDEMSHGGIERGTITLLTGPSGVGKTTLGVQFMKEAAERGERSTVYTFDEQAATLLKRCENVNIPVREMVQHGSLSVVAVEALRFTPDEFANMVRRDVEDNGTRVVMIDSINGYKLSVLGADLGERLHALCRYLENVGVTVLLINEQQNISHFRLTDVGVSYLADNVVYLRYVEQRSNGHAVMGRVVGVLKKRLSDFEKTLHEFEVTAEGLRIGGPVRELGGIFGSVNERGGAEVAV